MEGRRSNKQITMENVIISKNVTTCHIRFRVITQHSRGLLYSNRPSLVACKTVVILRSKTRKSFIYFLIPSKKILKNKTHAQTWFQAHSQVRHLILFTLVVGRHEVGSSRGAIVSEDDQDRLLAVVVLVALCKADVAAVVALTLARLDGHQQPCIRRTTKQPVTTCTHRLHHTRNRLLGICLCLQSVSGNLHANRLH